MNKELPLNLLSAWDGNPRIETNKEAVAEMKASIRTNGLLQNLLVFEDPNATGTYRVFAGVTRLTALNELVADGDIPSDYMVKVEVRPYDEVDVLAVAIAENVVRRNMEPIDEAVAFAELAKKGVPDEAIAEAFGCSSKTVKRRLALGRLLPEAQDAIRKGGRDLAWGAAMAGADTATQSRIMRDIDQNPDSWQNGHEVMRLLTNDTIPAEHALFDSKDYQGTIVQTLFDGNFYSDRAAFWELQDKEIEKLKGDLDGEGWSAVEVSREPVDLWRFEQTSDMTLGKAVIEVLSNGKVTVHRGLVDPVGMAETDDDSLPEDDDAHDQEGSYEGAAVRTTPGVLAYAADQRSAIIQGALAEDMRASLEVVVAAMIGHNEIAMNAASHKFAGDVEKRTSEAFKKITKQRDEIQAMYKAMGIDDPGRSSADVMTAVQGLKDADLNRLFCLLTATKIGQVKAKRLDSDETSITNMLAARLGVTPRTAWHPTAEFFEMMNANDLRRLAQALLPQDRQGGLLAAKKPNLVRLLSDTFEDAASNDGTLDPVTRDRLNAWTPGPMAFPAVDERSAGAESGEAADAMAALFGLDEENGTAVDVDDLDDAEKALFGGADADAE